MPLSADQIRLYHLNARRSLLWHRDIYLLEGDFALAKVPFVEYWLTYRGSVVTRANQCGLSTPNRRQPTMLAPEEVVAGKGLEISRSSIPEPRVAIVNGDSH